MGIEIPSGLQFVAYLTGSQWPQGDETAMFRIASDWHASAETLADLVPDLNRVRQETMSVLMGQTADAAQQQFAMLFDGDYSVDKLAHGVAALGDLAKNCGTEIEYTKLQIITSLAIAAAEIAYALACAVPSGGVSLGWIPVTEGLTMAAVRAIVSQLLRQIVEKLGEALTKTAIKQLVRQMGKEAFQELATGLGQELAIQGYQMAQGHRSELDLKQLRDTGVSSAVGGAAAAPISHGMGHALGQSSSALGGIGKGAVTGYTAGVVGNVAGTAATGGQLDATSIFGGAATGALSGGAHGASAPSHPNTNGSNGSHDGPTHPNDSPSHGAPNNDRAGHGANPSASNGDDGSRHSTDNPGSPTHDANPSHTSEPAHSNGSDPSSRDGATPQHQGAAPAHDGAPTSAASNGPTPDSSGPPPEHAAPAHDGQHGQQPASPHPIEGAAPTRGHDPVTTAGDTPAPRADGQYHPETAATSADPGHHAADDGRSAAHPDAAPSRGAADPTTSPTATPSTSTPTVAAGTSTPPGAPPTGGTTPTSATSTHPSTQHAPPAHTDANRAGLSPTSRAAATSHSALPSTHLADQPVARSGTDLPVRTEGTGAPNTVVGITAERASEPAHLRGTNSQNETNPPESAAEVSDGVATDGRIKFSGHGDYDPTNGEVSIPHGTTFTIYGQHGATISDRLGNLIETGGNTSEVYSRTFQPGEKAPNYTLHPPDGLHIAGDPITVETPTNLNELLLENQGHVDWAACVYDPGGPGAGHMYTTEGIVDETMGQYVTVYDSANL